MVVDQETLSSDLRGFGWTDFWVYDRQLCRKYDGSPFRCLDCTIYGFRVWSRGRGLALLDCRARGYNRVQYGRECDGCQRGGVVPWAVPKGEYRKWRSSRLGLLDLCDLPGRALSGRSGHAGFAVERSQSRGYAEGRFRKGLEE
jgi:hypothetical protein